MADLELLETEKSEFNWSLDLKKDIQQVVKTLDDYLWIFLHLFIQMTSFGAMNFRISCYVCPSRVYLYDFSLLNINDYK